MSTSTLLLFGFVFHFPPKKDFKKSLITNVEHIKLKPLKLSHHSEKLQEEVLLGHLHPYYRHVYIHVFRLLIA